MAKTKVVRGFDKDNAGTISTLAREAVEKALAKYGINVSYGGGRFKELEFNLKFKLSVESSDGVTQPAKDYRTYQSMYDLPEDMLGATIRIQGEDFTVDGFLPKKRKNNIQITRVSDGKGFIVSHVMAKRVYEAKPPAQLKKKVGAVSKVQEVNGKAKHPFGGECGKGCKPEEGIHVVFDSKEAREKYGNSKGGK